MAVLSSDGKYVTVEKGDSLWKILTEFNPPATMAKCKQLGTINNLANIDLIYVGQKIYLTSSGSSTSSSSSNAVTLSNIGLLATSDNELFVTWTWSKESQTEKYKVLWTYDLGNGLEIGSPTEITVDEDDLSLSRYSMFTIPDGARKVWCKVKPISKTYEDSNKNQKTHWEVGYSSKKSYTVASPLTAPSAPTVKIEKDTLTATLDGLDIDGANAIVFQIVREVDDQPYKTNRSEIKYGSAGFSWSIELGYSYKVRCYAYNTDTTEKSDWSPYTASSKTIPTSPASAPRLKATSETSIYVEWDAITTADTYDIEYATEQNYFDNTDQTSTKTGIEETHFEFIGLESGLHYWFRVRATNEQGSSEWSELSDVIIGEAPSAPTTWSSTTTAIVGEPVILYWVHNSKDGSSQTLAEIEFTIDGVLQQPSETIRNDREDDEKDKTSSYEVDTSEFVEGTKLEWRVRTMGIAQNTEDGGYGDWSVMRTVDIYAQPTLTVALVNLNGNEINDLSESPLTSYPFYLNALAGPKTQAPIGYHVGITSNQVYETVDVLGNPRVVNDGESLYSKYFDTFEQLMVEFTPGNLDLANGMSYTATCTVSMNSGLTAEASVMFSVAWTEVTREPNAEIGIDPETLTATIRPYCSDSQMMYYKVELNDGVYTKTEESLGYILGEIVQGVTTTTGEKVYSGVSSEGEEVYYCSVLESTRITDVFLSVYRREYDGKFTELATGLDSAQNIAVSDPHPALDYARYRIVATSKATGAVDYYDLPGHEVNGKAIVIQWDEDWTNFDLVGDEMPEQPAWSGSLLKLPYNVTVNEAPSPDVSFVEYVGREHPVSYYGTQVGESASWSTVVPKSDKEIIYALRRLAKWMGDAYVREPSGVGYWANITVSFNQKFDDLTVPVTFSIRRVEGGV